MNPLFIGPLFDVVKQLLSGLGLDPQAKAQAQQQAFDLLTKGDFAANADLQLALAQLSVNKAEAESPGLFKGGWRPAMGWLCVASCAWNWLGIPLVTTGALIVGRVLDVKPADLSQMWPILLALLGLGGLRTVERMGGKS